MSEPYFLNHRFAAHTRKDWEAEAKRTLKDRDLSDFTSHTADGVEIDVLYQGVTDAPPLTQMAAVAPSIMSLVIENNGSVANAHILSELEGGASGVVLPLVRSGKMGLPCELDCLNEALAGVYLEAASLAFRPESEAIPAATTLFKEFLADQDEAYHSVSLGADPIGAAYSKGGAGVAEGLRAIAELAAKGEYSSNITLLTASGIYAHEGGATEAIELAALICSVVAFLRALEYTGVTPEKGAPLISLELSADADLFISLAKLRAARMTVARLRQAANINSHFAGLHVQTSARMMATSDVATNMLRTTTAALAAGLGGADSLTALPFTHALGKPQGLARRIARNTGAILAEESFIGAVSDPSRGAGYIEDISGKLAAQAWEHFRQIEAAGGVETPKGAGLLGDKIARAEVDRQTEISSGATKLVGANAFVNKDDQPPKTEAWPT